MTDRTRRRVWLLVWIALAIPALWQISLMVRAIAGRFTYPYDLEWMEGGLLQHAQRISDGQGIYGPPSIEFIPYLYTPLYPGLIAFLGGAFGISYQLGRALSVLALIGIAGVTIGSIVRWRPRLDARLGSAAGLIAGGAASGAVDGGIGRGPRWVGATLAFGVFAAHYPFVEGWYDLVRADTLFLFMVTAGVFACARWARLGVGSNGDALMMAAATILVLAFFTKQTGVIYVGWGGVVIIASWTAHFAAPGDGRRVAGYAVLAALGAIGVAVAVGFAAGAARGVLAGVAAVLVGETGVMWRIGRRGALTAATRRLAVFGATGAVLGIGGVMLLDRITHGWFWTYVFKVHQAHDFHMPRFWDSFGNVLWRFPALTIAIAVTLVAIIVTAVARPSRHRRMPEASGPFLLWTATYAVSTVVGAIGFGTEFAHFNAYMPALLHGALAVGAAVPAIAGCMRAWTGSHRPIASHVTAGAAAAVALAGAITLGLATWDPGRYVPRDGDRIAGDKLVARIAAIDGDVWVPSHPWYAHLAGKKMFAHRMGIKDVTVRKPRPVIGLDAALKEHRFAAIVLDQRDVHQEIAGFTAMYRTDVALPGDERPRVYTGNQVVPEAVWIPAVKEKPPFGVRVLFDFESGRFDGWEIRGNAWGKAPANGAVSGQAVVGGFGGRFFATSMRGGEKATGTLLSQPFVIDGSKISLRVGGGYDERLRVGFRIDGHVVRMTTAQVPVGERLVDVQWDVSELRDQTAQLVAIDDNDTISWAHLNVDEVWLWP